MSTLAIAVDDSTRTYAFTKSSGPGGATVSNTGNINVANCAETNIDIQWTLSTGTFSTTGNAVTISGNGNNQIFGDPVLSNHNKTCTVRDSNPESSTNKSFTYTIHECNSQDDPTIRNR